MNQYVLDTNMISFYLRRHLRVIERLDQVHERGDTILGCPVVWYEVRRGLLVTDARQQQANFEKLIKTFVWDQYEWQDWSLAATLWAQRRGQGHPIADADLLIAVFARNRDAILVTDNEKDFLELGVTVENWITG